MSSFDTLTENGFAAFVDEHPFQFGVTFGLFLAVVAVVNGGSPLAAFVLFSVVGSLLAVVSSYLRVAFGGDETDDGPSEMPADEDRALERLREQYATGRIDEDEFERRVERLLRSESADEAAEWEWNVHGEARAATGETAADKGSERDVASDR
jgi:uncharacterized membrane protein